MSSLTLHTLNRNRTDVAVKHFLDAEYHGECTAVPFVDVAAVEPLWPNSGWRGCASTATAVCQRLYRIGTLSGRRCDFHLQVRRLHNVFHYLILLLHWRRTHVR